MKNSILIEKASEYLKILCFEISTRQVGSQGNRDATDFFKRCTSGFGFQTDQLEFDCIDWTSEGVVLEVKGQRFEAFSSPYSLGCQVVAPLVVIGSVDELKGAEITGKVALLYAEIAREQIMPKYFPFYNPDEHQEIIRLLEQKAPLAIIAATDRNPELVGALYPFPLFEDGDFDIPSVFMTEEQGLRLAELAGEPVSLISEAQRIKANGFNVSAQKVGRSGRRIVLTAHIDARIGSPGALDDGSGIVILLLLADLLQDYTGEIGIELLAFNGEDYYSAPGQIAYLKNKQAELESINLDINLDDVGYIRGNTAFSFYDCPELIVDLSRKVLLANQGIVEGEQWYQGDHMVFVQNHIPALAIISENYQEAMREFTHTAKDLPAMVDPAKLVQVALALRELLYEFNAKLA